MHPPKLRSHHPDVYFLSPNQTPHCGRLPPTNCPSRIPSAIEVPMLEFIYNTRYNHKLYNLIQNTPYEQSPNTEKHNIIEELGLLRPLLQTKHIFRLIAKLLTSSDIIHDVFPHGFFTDD